MSDFRTTSPASTPAPSVAAVGGITTSTSGGTTVDADPFWGFVALLSLVALGLYAPSGLLFLGFIGLIILVHEGGHFVAARRAGMEPSEFFWGFGPEIVAFERNGCRYGIKALFLGGYVKLWGMTPSSVLPAGVSEAGTYRAASHWGRLSTILAGPAVNLVTGAAAFGVARSMAGQDAWSSFVGGWDDTWFVITATTDALWTWASQITGYLGFLVDPSTEAPVRFMSPVSQATVTGEAVSAGWARSLQWFGILSVAIGALNLVPLPPLDGSHAMVAMSEKVAQLVRRDRSLRFDVRRLEPVAYVTIGALVLLSVTALVMDIRDVI